MSIKVLDRFFLKGFLGPYLLSFFLVLFVLVMQKLWKDIEDLLGRGYGILDFVELLTYFGLGLIPLALPLTVLLSSVMIYGGMAERYELTALKSSGVSLMRILSPGLAVAIFTMILSLFASNFIKPTARELFETKLKNMKTNELTFGFDEKVFNREFNNYSIWIDKKYEDGRTVEGIKIYDHNDPDNTIVNLIAAKRGEMYTTADQKYLIMELEDGYQLKEIRSESAIQDDTKFNLPGRPVSRVNFNGLRKVFKLSELLNLNVITVSEKKMDFLTFWQLEEFQDSLAQEVRYKKERSMHPFGKLVKSYSQIAQDKHDKELEEEGDEDGVHNTNSSNLVVDEKPKRTLLDKKKTSKITTVAKSTDKSRIKHFKRTPKPIINMLDISPDDETILDMLKTNEQTSMLDKAIKTAKTLRDNSVNRHNDYQAKFRYMKFANLKYHQQFAWAVVCLVFLFIGGPAGAIVRKGGFGFPLLIAIGFYIMFIMTYITGEKLLKSDTLSDIQAAWLPVILLLPFAIVLSYMALHDKNLSGFSLKTKLQGVLNRLRPSKPQS